MNKSHAAYMIYEKLGHVISFSIYL